MTRRGIRTQLLIAGVAPAVLVTLVVATWLVGVRVLDLREHEQRLGQIVASQLAPAAEYGVFSGNTAVLRRLAEAALVEADLRSVVIRDRNGMVLVRAAKPLPDRAPSTPAEWLAMRLVEPGTTIEFRAPIVQPATDLGEFDAPADDLRLSEIGSVEIEIAVLPGIVRELDAMVTGAALALAGLLASLLLAHRLGDRIGTPIRRLFDAMRRVRDGDLSVRVAETSTNEIGALESGLNRMADEVERTQRTLEEQVERATSDLQQTVAALEVSNVELDLARRRAIEASHLKGEFLASMSHEIRTPMSGIIGFAELLSRSPLDAVQREQVATIRHSADALLRILNDVLDLSRIEAGKLSLADEPFDVRTCIDDVLSLLATLAYEKGLDLRRGVSRAVPTWLRGDSARVRQIVMNLVGNAIKYTPDGSVTVEVDLAPHPQPGCVALTLVVTDTGIGIQESAQRRLFQAFSQATPSTARFPGAGLGLVISNKLVEAMGGEIELSSAPGHGTRIAVTLNLLPAAATESPPRWPGRRVLVADPDPLTRDHIAQLLEAEGAAVTMDGLPPGPGDHELAVVGLPRADAGLLRELASAPGEQPPVVALIGTHDAARFDSVRAALGAVCLPRCVTVDGLKRAVGRALGDAVDPVDDPTDRSHALAGLRLLVVDDNRVNRVLLVQQLTALGAEVDAASSGEDAITRCEAGRYDGILLDLQMPGIGGLETARRLRMLPRRCLVVAVTANILAGRDHGARVAGIAAVLVKPVDEAVVTGLLRAHRARMHAAKRDLAALSTDMRELLREELPVQVAAFASAVDAADRARVATTVHDLAGTAAVCRLRGLAAAAADVRERADPAAVERLFCEASALECALTEDPDAAE